MLPLLSCDSWLSLPGKCGTGIGLKLCIPTTHDADGVGRDVDFKLMPALLPSRLVC